MPLYEGHFFELLIMKLYLDSAWYVTWAPSDARSYCSPRQSKLALHLTRPRESPDEDSSQYVACLERASVVATAGCRSYLTHYASHKEAKTDRFDYNRFYNHRRRHSTLGYLSPMVFERRSRAVALNYLPPAGDYSARQEMAEVAGGASLSLPLFVITSLLGLQV